MYTFLAVGFTLFVVSEVFAGGYGEKKNTNKK